MHTIILVWWKFYTTMVKISVKILVIPVNFPSFNSGVNGAKELQALKFKIKATSA